MLQYKNLYVPYAPAVKSGEFTKVKKRLRKYIHQKMKKTLFIMVNMPKYLQN